MTNLPGMFMGFVMMKIMGIKLYDWFGREGKTSVRDWDIWYNHYRLGAFGLSLVINVTQFLTTFFLANALHFQVCDPVVQTTRSIFWVIAGILANKENHDFANQDPKGPCKVQGEFRWIMFTMMALELAICLKFYSYSVFIPESFKLPLMCSCFWVVLIVGGSGYYFYLKYCYWGEARRKFKEAKIKGE
jgi:hypothetical protein